MQTTGRVGLMRGGGLVLAMALVAAMGCNGGSAAPQPEGPLKVGIVSGQDQMAQAGSPRLGAPVVGKLVRLPNGTVAFRWERPLNRALDVLVPRAYAQGTVLNGAPVAGAVVCAKSVDATHPLEPAVPCTSTDTNGQVTFVFTPGTKAGDAKAVVQGMDAGVVATYDTARATVIPDSTSLNVTFLALGPDAYGLDTAKNAGVTAAAVHASDQLDLLTKVLRSGDKYGNPITAYGLSWTLVPLTSETFTHTGSVNDMLPQPPAYTKATAPAAHAGSVVTGFQPGYEALTIFVNGVPTTVRLLAVFP